MFTPTNRRVRFNVLPVSMLTAIGLACAIMLADNRPHQDLWSHARFGAEISELGLVNTPTYAYSTSSQWINHEHLTLRLISTVVDNFGPAGLILGKCLLGLVVLFLLYLNCRRWGVGLLTICAISLLVAANMARNWTTSPAIISYACFALLLFCLQGTFLQWSDRWRLRIPWPSASPLTIPNSNEAMQRLWLLPILFLFWANLHGGFLVGLATLFIYLFCRSLEALTTQRCDGWPFVKRFGLIALASTCATLINPYGIQLHLSLLRSVAMPPYLLGEWQLIDLTDPKNVVAILIVCDWVFSLVLSRQGRDFTGLVISTLALVLAAENPFFLPLFAISFGIFIPVHFESVCRLYKISTVSRFEAHRSMSGIAMIVMTVGLVVVLTVCFAVSPLSIPLAKKDYPVSAMRYIQHHRLSGKMIVDFKWSSFVLGQRPRSNRQSFAVSLDRRYRQLYPQSVIAAHVDFFKGPANTATRSNVAADRVLEDGDPDLVLIQRNRKHAVGVLKNHTDWTLLYQDSIAQVWGRASRFGSVESKDYLAPAARQISNRRETGHILWLGL